MIGSQVREMDDALSALGEILLIRIEKAPDLQAFADVGEGCVLARGELDGDGEAGADGEEVVGEAGVEAFQL